MVWSRPKNPDDIVIPNKYCQLGRNRDEGFRLLDPGQTRRAYLSFCLLVLLKTDRRWRNTTLHQLCDMFPVDTNRARALTILKECLVNLVREEHIHVIDKKLKKLNSIGAYLGGESLRKCKPSTKLDVAIIGTKKHFFAVSRSVLKIVVSCGYRGLALYLILRKNQYKASLGVFDTEVARLPIEHLCEVSEMTNQTVIKYLKLLEKNSYIVSHNENENKKQEDGTFSKDSANEYLVIDPRLTPEERATAVAAIREKASIKNFNARRKENWENKARNIAVGLSLPPYQLEGSSRRNPFQESEDDWGSVTPNGFRPTDVDPFLPVDTLETILPCGS